MENLIDCRELSRITGLKEGTIYKLVHTHGLPCKRINSKTIRFGINEAARWIEDNRANIRTWSRKKKDHSEIKHELAKDVTAVIHSFNKMSETLEKFIKEVGA